MTFRRPGSRAVAVLAALAGSGLIVLAGGRVWATQPVTGVPGLPTAQATGTDAAPAVTALALVAVAGAVALLLAGRLARLVVAVAVTLAGLGAAALAWTAAQDPAAAVAAAVVTATGRTGRDAGGQAAGTVWPWLAVAGGLLAALGGATGAWRTRSWQAGGRRFQVAGGTGAGGGDEAADGPGDSVGLATGRSRETAATVAEPPVPGGPADPRRGRIVQVEAGIAPSGGRAVAGGRREADLDAWDALSRGEDPTDPQA